MKFYTMKQEKLGEGSKSDYRTLEEELKHGRKTVVELSRLIEAADEAEERLLCYLPDACGKAINKLDKEGGSESSDEKEEFGGVDILLELQLDRFALSKPTKDLLRDGCKRHVAFRKELLDSWWSFADRKGKATMVEDRTIDELCEYAKVVMDEGYGFISGVHCLSVYILDMTDALAKLRKAVALLLYSRQVVADNITETDYHIKATHNNLQHIL